jgi:hypothetical protein
MVIGLVGWALFIIFLLIVLAIVGAVSLIRRVL